MLTGTLCGVEMALTVAGVPFRRGGVDAAIELLADKASRIHGARRLAEPGFSGSAARRSSTLER